MFDDCRGVEGDCFKQLQVQLAKRVPIGSVEQLDDANDSSTGL